MTSRRSLLLLGLLLIGAAWIQDAAADEGTDFQALAEEYKKKYEEAAEALAMLKEELSSSVKQADLQSCKSEKDTLVKEKEALTKEKDQLAEQRQKVDEVATQCTMTLQQAQNSAQAGRQCQDKLRGLRDELLSHKAAAAEAGSCKRDLEEHKHKLAKALASAEEMLLPPWLARRLEAAAAKGKELYQAAAASEAAAVGLKYYQQAREAAAPHLAVVQEHWAKVSEAAWYKKLLQEVRKVEGELGAFITAQLKAQPALAAWADPVVVQLLVYAVLASPLVLLLPLLSACFGSGKGGSAEAASEGRGGGKKAAAAEKRPAAARATRGRRA